MLDKNSSIFGKLIIYNTLFNLAGFFCPIILNIVTIPFVLKGLGEERFGILVLAWTVVGYLGLFDLGIGRATTKFIAEAFAKNAYTKLPILIWSSVFILSFFGIFATIILYCTTPFLVEKILKVPLTLIRETKSVFYVVSFSLPFILCANSLRGMLEGAQKFDLINIVRIPVNMLMSLAPVIGVLFKWNLSSIIMSIVLIRIASLLIYWKICINLYPNIKRITWPQKETIKSFFAFGGWITVSNIIAISMSRLDKFLIGTLIGIKAVTYYSVAHEAVRCFSMIATSLAMALFPAFSGLQSIREYERLNYFFERSIRFLLLIMGPLTIAMMVLARNILSFWVGISFAKKSTLVFQILILGFFINAVAWVPFSLLQASGRVDIPPKIQMVIFPVSFFLLILLIFKWGIIGAAIAVSIKFSIGAILIFIACYCTIPYMSFSNAKKNVTLITTLGGFGVGVYFVNKLLIFNILLRFTAFTLLYTFFGIISWYVFINKNERQFILTSFQIRRRNL